MKNIKGEGASALMVIDVQRYFVNADTAHVPAAIAEYIQAHRDKYAVIVFTKFVNTPSAAVYRLLQWKKCLGPPDTDIAPELEPVLHYGVVVEKNVYSAFHIPQIQQILTDHHVDTLVFCGADTDCCILATASNAFDQGYRVILLESLSGSHTGPSFHNAGVAIFQRNLGPVMKTLPPPHAP